jgi:DNA-binding CsgD family transcriptional regulator/tetratricopeptide (TPR) repeat protein
MGGRLAVVDITGEAGIGKSRLLAEFTSLARRRGVTVLRGRATEYERHSPFQPFADAFSDLDHRALRTFPPLRNLPPELRGRTDPTAESWKGDRFGLYRTTADALRRIRGSRLAVVLEDLHWADPASVELVDHLIRHPVAAPFLLVVSRRDRQAPAALTAALTRGADTGTVLPIALGPLDERDCLERLAQDLPPQQASVMYAASEGNPLYFLALLHAHRTNPLPDPGGVLGLDGAPHPTWGLGCGHSAGLEALLLDELAPLDSLERGTAEAVAVLGDHAGADMIAALTGAPVAEVIEALRRAMRRDLIRTDGSGHRLSLRHPLIRTLVHENIDPWRRRKFHRGAAVELARAGAPLVEQAHHIEWSLTDWDPAAAAVLTKAAEQTAVTAPATSAHWLGVVLRTLPDTGEHVAMRRELMLRRAAALGTTGALRESRELMHQIIRMPGLDTIRAEGANGAVATDDGHDALRTAAVIQCSVMERFLGRFMEAEALLRRELARRPGPSPSQRIALVIELCCCAQFLGRFPEVREELAQALVEARALGDGLGEMGALTLAAMAEAYEGNTVEARRLAGIAGGLADVLTDSHLAGLCEPLARLGWTEVILGNYTDAERHSDRGMEIARRSGRLYVLSQLLLSKAYTHFMTCRITTALELADEAAAIARALGYGELLGFTLAIRSLFLVQARPPGNTNVVAAAEEAVASLDGTADNWWSTVARYVLAFASMGAGDPHRARDALLEAGGGTDLTRLQPSLLPEFLDLLVAAALAVGETAEATQWAERARKEAERLDLPTQRAAALCALGRIQAYRKDPAAAARSFAEAAREGAQCGALLREAQSLLLGAPCSKMTGDGHRAAAMWRRARRLAAEGGATRLLTLADEQLAEDFGERGGVEQPSRTTAGPNAGSAAGATVGSVGGLALGSAVGLGQLTSREWEIAELVAEGLINQAVASKLCLSRRTVESHLSRVYRKTGVHSRAALATLLARHAGREDDTTPLLPRS